MLEGSDEGELSTLSISKSGSHYVSGGAFRADSPHRERHCGVGARRHR